MKLLHAGLQRTGTNFLCTILKNNFFAHVINDDPTIARNAASHKHCRIQDNKNSICMDSKYYNEFYFFSYEDYRNNLNFSNLKAVIVYKDPVNWLESILQWGIKCNWIKSQEEFKDVWEGWLNEYVVYYNKWFGWRSHKDEVYIIQYENLILDFDNQMDKLSTFLNVKEYKKDTTSKVDQSDTRTELELLYNTQNSCFPPDTIKKIYSKSDMVIERRLYEL